tara:strand:- start:842 stop:1045 length:204 start_codon:yes stop_codon:yes gene_type:complete
MVRNLGILNVLLFLPILVDQYITEPDEVTLTRTAMIKKGIVIGGMSNRARSRFVRLGIMVLLLNGIQ